MATLEATAGASDLATAAVNADGLPDFSSATYKDAYSRINAIVIEGEQEAHDNYIAIGTLIPEQAEELTKPDMTGEWEYKLRQMEHNKFSREQFMEEIVKVTEGIVARTKSYEEDETVARVTDIPSPTDGKPLRETLRGYKSQDGEFMVYKVIGGRKMEEAEVKQLVTTGQVGPLDGFVSAKTRALFSALLRLVKDEEKGKWVAQYDFGDKVDLGTVEPYWTDPVTGAGLCEVGSSHEIGRAHV